ncbi:MAG: hypothetical protein GY833_16315 [Aestuariibacter sp.]|nr:hypothetical protein [Aestuariibacter sp.]
MQYKIIQPPFTIEFHTMNRDEANSYFNWFMEQISDRIQILEQAIQSIAGYENWQATYTPQSLERLGQWFCEQVETRKRTKREKKEIYNESPTWFKNIEIEGWELTDRTFSLAMDIGMYFGRTFEKNFSKLTWVMVTKPKNDANFQQPVLSGTGKLVLNPIWILVTYAYGIARHSKGPQRLRELYNTWMNLLVE